MIHPDEQEVQHPFISFCRENKPAYLEKCAIQFMSRFTLDTHTHTAPSLCVNTEPLF